MPNYNFKFSAALMAFFLFSKVLFAQNNFERADLVKIYKEMFKEADHVALKSNTTFTFSLLTDPKTKTTEVRGEQFLTEELLSLKEGVTGFANSIYFDDVTEIEKFKVMDEKGKDISNMAVSSTSNYSEGGIFYSDAKLFVFKVPMMDEGKKVSYQWLKKYKDVKYLTTVYFTEHYPIVEKTVKFEIPTWLDVEILERNFLGYDMTRNVSVDKKTENKVIEYSIKNLDARKSENHSPGPSHNLPHFIVLIKSFKTQDGSKQVLFNSVDDLYKWCSSLTKEVDNQRSALKEQVQKLTEGQTTDQDKIEALFYWVQDNIRYIAFEDGVAAFKPASCQTVYSKKYGDCKGMANLLKEMLIEAGYDARLTWIGTRRIAYDSIFPTISMFNHMICTVILNGEKIFLDPTETYIPYGEVAYRIQGKHVIIENGNSYIIEKIPEYDKMKNKIEIRSEVALDGGSLKGWRKEVYEGGGKVSILRDYNYLKTDKKEEELKNFITGRDKNFIATNIKTSDLQERRDPLKIDYDFVLENQVLDLDKEKFITLDYNKEFSKFTFDSTRQNDYVFENKYYKITKISLKLPEGYKVKHLPSNYEKKHKDFTFKINYIQKGDVISFVKEISIDNAIIRKKDFKEWNDMIKEVKEIYNDQIIIEN